MKTASAMPGYYNEGFTLCTYTHAIQQAQDAATATMGEVMAQMV